MVSGSTGKNAGGESVFESGSTTWNIADGFTKINVLKILIEINLFEILAKFGKQDVEQQVFPSEIPYRRVDGFDRMLFALRQLMSNCMFAIKDKKDKEIAQLIVDRIDNVEKFADGIANETHNSVTKENELIINEEHFRKCLDTLTQLKQEVHFLLDRAGLIFRHDEGMDLDDIMNSIIDG